MERQLLARGALVGIVAGLVAFVFARVLAEPLIDRAVDYESARDDAQAALDRAAGLPVEHEHADIFSRGIQANLGIGVGVVLFGLAMGTLFAVAYAVCLGRVGGVRPRSLSLLLAAGGFVGVYLVPFLKYPANPPSIGHEDTIQQRSALYLVMVLVATFGLVVAAAVGQQLAPRLGTWNATVVTVLGYLVVIGVVMAVLPSTGELGANVREYGRHATETPQPLRDGGGRIVFPGFPADDMFAFRLYSVGAQLLLWTVLGVGFAPLAERVLRRGGAAPTAPVSVSAR
ncbi:putative cobalt transporter subunit CbtA [Motilibacter rhizosphaerae]|uniref:Putative cobalt transporter subunit CbtA n=1 Tax=Motilibacter rhizosphaerae TaxID=598652 RepID=A0A4Q7NX44_9ACTN|nr:CbtA family protein [Motilibacter rhizosphaerae]RZS91570.1 putative cobalt transporter subunit CbtA [Motilibacter rhizosphaerae]